MTHDTPRFNLDDAAYLGGKAGSHSYSPLQMLFILRLTKLLRDRYEWSKQLDSSDWRMKLLNKALYSTFCDCVETGIGEEARRLFQQKQTGNRA